MPRVRRPLGRDCSPATGIDPAGVEFLGWSPHAELLAQYDAIDVALDPFPYSGGLTTCEALWMGVPVITCPGETFASRHSLSHLSNVGLTETIARDLDEYVEIAVALAGDLPRLAAHAGRPARADGRLAAVRRPPLRPEPGGGAPRCVAAVVRGRMRNAEGRNLNLDGADVHPRLIPEPRTPSLMPTLAESLALAVQHHQAGRLAQAEQLYRQILAANPNQAQAWHLLGVVAQQVGQPEVAIQHIERAIELRGDAAEFYNNLGEAYRAVGRAAQAVACYRLALTLEPDFVGAHTNQGIALKDLGKLEEAIACHRQALAFQPDCAAAYNNLGNALIDRGSLDEAIASFGRALELSPDYALAHNNLGNALKDQGRLDEALACYRRALELEPGSATVHSNLLLTLQYSASATPAELAAAHAEYERRHAAPLPAAGAQQNLQPRTAGPAP